MTRKKSEPMEIDNVRNDSVNQDNLILKRKGGGSVIDHRPLFSQNGEFLYIISIYVLKAFSTKTGDFVKDFEPVGNRIIGACLCEKYEGTVIGCTESGEIAFWNADTGKIRKTFNLKISAENAKLKTFHVVTCNNQQTDILVSYMVHKEGEKDLINLETFNVNDGSAINLLGIDTLHDQYFLDIIGNHGENLIAVAHGINLHIVKSSNLNKLRNLKTSYTITCIAGHPVKESIATGDTNGRVLLWHGLLQKTGNEVFHWHTLPVTEIAFSPIGNHMYTGGGECVLVKWTFGHMNNKSFLPRLPAPIRHLTIAPENRYVAVLTLDNGITITNPERKLTALIQNFSQGMATSSTGLFPAGLAFDPRTKSLVMNSRTGHIQFYNQHTKHLIYNVHITGQNYITNERDAIVVNTEVTKLALNHDGTWLATVEERDDKISSKEIRLKFWMYNSENRVYELNTSIELPHENGVNDLRFQSNRSFDESNAFAITTGQDKLFKLWTLVSPTSIYKTTKHWQCQSIGFYLQSEPTSAAFSEDGSILGVAFNSTLTLWDPETMEMKKALPNLRYKEKIIKVEFGKKESSLLVVVASRVHMAVYNLLTLRPKWSVPLKIALLTSDPLSSHMAVFTTENTLFVFTPMSGKPVYTRENVVDKRSKVICATFVPHAHETKNSWQRKSQLYFLDSYQELLTLEPEAEMESTPIDIKFANAPTTAFARMMAMESTSTKDPITHVHEQLNEVDKTAEERFMSIPAHRLMLTRDFCREFILSTLLPSKSLNEIPALDESMETDGPILIDLEEEDESNTAQQNTDSKNIEEDDHTLSGSKIVQHDWSFLL